MSALGGGASVGGGGGPGAGGEAASGGGEASGGGASGGGTGGGGISLGGPSGCENSALTLCDGFEGESINSSLWSVGKSSQNTVELVADQAARGAKSVHIHTQDGFGYLKNESFFPAPMNNYFGRMFVRVARFSTVDWAHWTLAEAAGTGDGSVIRVGGQYKTDASKNRWGIGSDSGPTGDWTNHDEDPNGNPSEPPTNTWVCLEWEHRGSENVTRFFVDDVEHPSLATTVSNHGGSSVDYILPQMTSVWFGFWQYQADSEGFDVWIDEVALNSERIGCTR